MNNCIDDEMDTLLAIEIEKVRQENLRFSELPEEGQQKWNESIAEFHEAFFKPM